MSVMLEIMDLLNTHTNIVLDDTGEQTGGKREGGRGGREAGGTSS